MFRAADLSVLTKLDLIDAVGDFDSAAATCHLRNLVGASRVFEFSARSRFGWMSGSAASVRPVVIPKPPMPEAGQRLELIGALTLPLQIRALNVRGGHERTIGMAGLRSAQPDDIALRGKARTPRAPVRPWMVPDEGACDIWRASGRRAEPVHAARQ